MAIIYKNDRYYRSRSALEVIMKPSAPTLSQDNKIQDWPDGKMILSFYPRADMKAPIEFNGRISVAMSFLEMNKIFKHYMSGPECDPAQVDFTHKIKDSNNQTVMKKVVGNWYAKDENSPFVYNLTAWQDDRRITVMLGYEEFAIMKELTSICIKDSFRYDTEEQR